MTADVVPAKGRAGCVPATLLMFLDSLRKIGFVVLDTVETVEYRRSPLFLILKGIRSHCGNQSIRPVKGRLATQRCSKDEMDKKEE